MEEDEVDAFSPNVLVKAKQKRISQPIDNNWEFACVNVMGNNHLANMKNDELDGDPFGMNN